VTAYATGSALEGLTMRRLTHRGGFTLIEVLVVIAIMGTLTGLLLAAVQRVRQAAARTSCSNHLRQIGLALQMYHDANHSLPPGVSYQDGADPFPFMGWQARLLPYIEQQALWEATVKAFGQDRWFENNPPHMGFATVIPIYNCPMDSRVASQFDPHTGTTVAHTSYLGVAGSGPARTDGVLFLDSHVRFPEVTDGLSNTLFVGERPTSADGMFGWWYGGTGQGKDGSADTVLDVREHNRNPFRFPDCPLGPYEFGPGRIVNQCDALHFWSLHAGGGHFAFGDGSVRFLSYSAASIMPALATRAGGESVVIPD
jgi:prepilin-type N-terminal cleavage/methylation domain-containing protein/prepilin-type processing-associated H-X9-DG protein